MRLKVSTLRAMGKMKVAGSLYGLAIGDALGAPTEFLGSVEAIEKRFGPGGPTNPEGDPARVTDDTQMALAVGRALLSAASPAAARAGAHAAARDARETGAHAAARDARETGAPRQLSPATLERTITDEFVAWLRSPDNNRAPGNTCLQACRGLQNGKPWHQATVQDSKGCGANMRVTPVGLLPTGWCGADEHTRAAVAQYQAAFTHGHPTALAASDLTARAVTELVEGCAAAELAGRLRNYANEQRRVWHGDWLGDLWRRPGLAGEASPEAFIARGWDECLGVLDRLDAAIRAGDRRSDPCLATGAAWIAEEALATGLLCFVMFPDDPIAAVRRAATTSGDSDSIACLAGAFAGATCGLDAWPEDWRRRIEYREELDVLAATWEVDE
jgi:ADP-ribosylglycohydrolase